MSEIQPRIRVNHQNGVTVVDLLDKEILDEMTINNISESLFAVIEEHSPIKLVLDFKQVNHLSSSALGTLIRLNKKIDNDQGQFRLCSIKPELYQIFVITKLNKVFQIFDDLDAATAGL